MHMHNSIWNASRLSFYGVNWPLKEITYMVCLLSGSHIFFSINITDVFTILCCISISVSAPNFNGLLLKLMNQIAFSLLLTTGRIAGCTQTLKKKLVLTPDLLKLQNFLIYHIAIIIPPTESDLSALDSNSANI